MILTSPHVPKNEIRYFANLNGSHSVSPHFIHQSIGGIGIGRSRYTIKNPADKTPIAHGRSKLFIGDRATQWTDSDFNPYQPLNLGNSPPFSRLCPVVRPFLPRQCLERLGEVAACQAAKYGWTSQLTRNVPDTDVRR